MFTVLVEFYFPAIGRNTRSIWNVYNFAMIISCHSICIWNRTRIEYTVLMNERTLCVSSLLFTRSSINVLLKIPNPYTSTHTLIFLVCHTHCNELDLFWLKCYTHCKPKYCYKISFDGLNVRLNCFLNLFFFIEIFRDKTYSTI